MGVSTYCTTVATTVPSAEDVLMDCCRDVILRFGRDGPRNAWRKSRLPTMFPATLLPIVLSYFRIQEAPHHTCNLESLRNPQNLRLNTGPFRMFPAIHASLPLQTGPSGLLSGVAADVETCLASGVMGSEQSGIPSLLR